MVNNEKSNEELVEFVNKFLKCPVVRVGKNVEIKMKEYELKNGKIIAVEKEIFN